MLLSVDGTTSLSKTSMEKVAMPAPLDPRRLSPDPSADVGVTGSFPAACPAAADDGGGGGGSSPPPRGAVIFAAAPPPRARSPGRSSCCIGLGLAPENRGIQAEREGGNGHKPQTARPRPRTLRRLPPPVPLRLGSPSRGNKRRR